MLHSITTPLLLHDAEYSPSRIGPKALSSELFAPNRAKSPTYRDRLSGFSTPLPPNLTADILKLAAERSATTEIGA